MKTGTLVKHRFRNGKAMITERGFVLEEIIGVVLGPSKNYYGHITQGWFHVQWTNGVTSTQTKDHIEVIND